jgi:two-component system, cell cycle sensor histidine kinase and response regulator CckA
MFFVETVTMKPSASQDADISGATSVGSYTPLLTSAAEAASTSAELNKWESSQTILLVEDEPFVRIALAEALESAGYNVLLAADAAQALEAQYNGIEAIDLLLTDVVMPNVSGHELARAFFVLSPQTEVLLMSGYEEQIIHCEQSLREIICLAKPFSISTLLQRVWQVMNRRSCGLRAPA